MCECYQIGGPWIAEDPDCPVHGRAACQDQEEAEERERSIEQRIESLERQVKQLTSALTALDR